MNEEIYNYFLKISKDIDHSDSTYSSHCKGIYDILKSINQPEYVCLAGLFHSVYSTEYFSLPTVPSRQEIIQVIGKQAENLVFIFCNLRDRHNIISNNLLNFESSIHKELAAIEYANLKEQAPRVDSQEIFLLCDKLLSIITEPPVTKFKISGKDVWVFDHLLENNDAEFLNEYCLNSVFRADHSSNNSLHYEVDSRFVANMSKDDFINTNLPAKIKKITQNLNTDIFIGNYYINHYGLLTGVSKHTDSGFSNHYTILVFCNKYWDETWGGEIVFYNDNSEAHTMFEFKPKRIIMFDSRIAHKVLPMTRNARKDRFTLAIKCSTQEGLEDLKKQYTNIFGIGK